MTYNVFSGTLNPTHFTSLHVGSHGGKVEYGILTPAARHFAFTDVFTQFTLNNGSMAALRKAH